MPLSVTAMVVCPVVRLSSSTSRSVACGVTLVSLTTNPALNFFTRRTISACSAIGCEVKMNARPPERASATAMVSSETDCIIAEISGTFRVSCATPGGRWRVRGERRLTLAGMHSRRVRLGSSRNSLNVREIPGTTVAMRVSQPETVWPCGARSAPVSMRSVVSQLMHSSVMEMP